jgi:hypothetical protein
VTLIVDAEPPIVARTFAEVHLGLVDTSEMCLDMRKQVDYHRANAEQFVGSLEAS